MEKLLEFLVWEAIIGDGSYELLNEVGKDLGLSKFDLNPFRKLFGRG